MAILYTKTYNGQVINITDDVECSYKENYANDARTAYTVDSLGECHGFNSYWQEPWEHSFPSPYLLQIEGSGINPQGVWPKALYFTTNYDGAPTDTLVLGIVGNDYWNILAFNDAGRNFYSPNYNMWSPVYSSDLQCTFSTNVPIFETQEEAEAYCAETSESERQRMIKELAVNYKKPDVIDQVDVNDTLYDLGATARNISFNNSKSDLTSTNVQNAITEVDSKIDNLTTSLATVATSGDYDDLINKPSIPANTSDLNNDAGFIDSSVDTLTNYYTKTQTDGKYMVKGVDYVTAGQASGSTLGTKATAEGNEVVPAGDYSHAEGSFTSAMGDYSHAEGRYTFAGSYAHAEGQFSSGAGSYSHAEGQYTFAGGSFAHAEGDRTSALGSYSHAEGNGTSAASVADHAEGQETSAYNYSHAEGNNTYAYGNSHAEGLTTTAGTYSHAEGSSTCAVGNSSHAEGNYTVARNPYAHAEGQGTSAFGESSHAEGMNTCAINNFSHAEGYKTSTIGVASHAEGNNTIATGEYAHAEGSSTSALSTYSHAEGSCTKTSSNFAHAEGKNTIAAGECSHAEGEDTIAAATGGSHAEGRGTSAVGFNTHAEGFQTYAAGSGTSHTEGYQTTAIGYGGSHAEGYQTYAAGSYSHAEGGNTTALGDYSHASGYKTCASCEYQHVEGKYNVADSTMAHIIGNGTSSQRSNAFAVSWDGDAYAGRSNGLTNDNKLPTGADVHNYIKDLKTPKNATITNGIAQFECIEENLVKGLKVTMNPIQDLHGYSNPWVGGAGKNKINFPDKTMTSAGVVYLENINPQPAGTYTFSCNADTFQAGSLKYYDASNNEYSATSVSVTATKIVYSIVSSVEFVKLRFYNTAGNFSNFMLEQGNQATDFAPYSNICPISGRTEASVNRGSVDITTLYNGQIQNTGAYNGDTKRICNVNNAQMNTYFLKKGTHTLTFNKLNQSAPDLAQCTVLTKNDNFEIVDNFATSWHSLPYTFELTADAYVYFTARKDYGTVLNTSDYKTLIIDETKTHQYQQEIYGGSDDFVNGGATSTKKYIELDENSNWEVGSGAVWFFIGGDNDLPTGTIIDSRLCSNMFKNGYNQNDSIWVIYRQIHIRPNSTIAPSGATAEGLAEFKNWLSTNNYKIQVCVDLATPTTISTSAEEITTVSGTNIISGTEPISECKYTELATVDDYKAYVDNQIQINITDVLNASY